MRFSIIEDQNPTPPRVQLTLGWVDVGNVLCGSIFLVIAGRHPMLAVQYQFLAAAIASLACMVGTPTIGKVQLVTNGILILSVRLGAIGPAMLEFTWDPLPLGLIIGSLVFVILAESLVQAPQKSVAALMASALSIGAALLMSPTWRTVLHLFLP